MKYIFKFKLIACLTICTFFLPFNAFAENPAKFEVIKVGDINATEFMNPIIDTLHEIQDVNFILHKDHDGIFTEKLPELEKWNRKYAENNDLLRKFANEFPEFTEPIETYLEHADPFAEDTVKIIDMLREMEDFKKNVIQTVMDLRRILTKNLLEMGYPEREVNHDVFNIKLEPPEKKRLIEIIKRYADKNQDRLEFDSYIDNLHQFDVSEHFIPFKERLITEEETVKKTFDFVGSEIEEQNNLGAMRLLFEFEEREEKLDEFGILEEMHNLDYDHIHEQLDVKREELQRSTDEFVEGVEHIDSDSPMDEPPHEDEPIDKPPPEDDHMEEPPPHEENIEVRPDGTFKKPIERQPPPNDKPKVVVQKSQSSIWDVLKVVIPVLSIIGGFLITRRRKGKFSKYLKEVDKVYTDYKLKSKRLEAELYRLKDMISEDLEKGKIDEAAFSIVEKRIEKYMTEAREQEINEQFGGLPQHLKKNMHQMLKDGKISEKEFEKMMSLVDSSTMDDSERESLKDMFKEWKDKDKKKK